MTVLSVSSPGDTEHTDTSGGLTQRSQVTPLNRRRLYTEEKPKVVVAAWGTELIQFLAATLHQDDLRNRMNSTYSKMKSSYPIG